AGCRSLAKHEPHPVAQRVLEERLSVAWLRQRREHAIGHRDADAQRSLAVAPHETRGGVPLGGVVLRPVPDLGAELGRGIEAGADLDRAGDRQALAQHDRHGAR
ncbi:MAG: hypothetical protein ACK56F_16010, partial [bacterium]